MQLELNMRSELRVGALSPPMSAAQSGAVQVSCTSKCKLGKPQCERRRRLTASLLAAAACSG
eukprot:1405880-Rhodomonas_salina.1